MTPKQIAKAYVETLNGSPNGWGQHVHPTLGISHVIRRRLRMMVGKEKAEQLIDMALREDAFDTL